MVDSWTTLRLIQWTTGYFEKKGIPNPRLDAELLLAHILKCARIDLYVRHDKIVSEKDLSKYKTLIERRAQREPLQYILEETEFWGLKIKVMPDVLIPRPETELLIEEVLKILKPEPARLDDTSRSPTSRKPSKDKWDESRDDGRAAIERVRLSVSDSLAGSGFYFLDIGTGSGCITIALAKEFPNAKIVATDVSERALNIARENAKHHGVENQIEFILADIAPWRVFQTQDRLFDMIVSNPPYISEQDYPNLQPEVRDFEPKTALVAASDGFSFLQQIMEEARPFLKSDGRLLLEMGETQAKAMQEISATHGYHCKIRKDYAEHDRIVILSLSNGSSKNSPCKKSSSKAADLSAVP